MAPKEPDCAFDTTRLVGLGKGFAPSATAAAKALGTVVRQDIHPPGVEGTNYSLTEMGKFIRDGRNDPRLRAWGGQTISRAEAAGLAKHIDYSAWVESDKLPAGGYTVRAKTKTKVLATATSATLAHAWQELSARLRGIGGLNVNYGKLKTPVQQTQAILDEIRRVTHYLQDPCNTELMATPVRTLCLDDHGLCLTSSDCDDRVIALASATLAIGIETRVVGQAYNGSAHASHVIAAILDEDGSWKKVDPSSDKYNVGQSYPASREWWLDPISGAMSSSPNGAPTTMGKEPDHGDFIGVGAVPVEPAPTGVGVFPMAHAFSVMAHGASYVPVGLEMGLPCFPDGSEPGAKEYAFAQQMVRGVGTIPTKLTAAQQAASTPQFNEERWAWRMPNWPGMSWSPAWPKGPAGGHWETSRLSFVEPTAGNPGGYWFYWYPWPVGMIVNGRKVSDTEMPGYTQTMPGYWVESLTPQPLPHIPGGGGSRAM